MMRYILRIASIIACCFLLMCIFCSGCVSISYSPETRVVTYSSFMKDISADPIRIKLTNDSAEIQMGKLKSDVSDAIEETIKAVQTGAYLK
jgi:hypothetical protein